MNKPLTVHTLSGNAHRSGKVNTRRRDRRIVARKCPLCTQEFSLKKKGDAASYDSAEYHAHLRAAHHIELPKLEVVFDEGYAQ